MNNINVIESVPEAGLSVGQQKPHRRKKPQRLIEKETSIESDRVKQKNTAFSLFLLRP